MYFLSENWQNEDSRITFQLEVAGVYEVYSDRGRISQIIRFRKTLKPGEALLTCKMTPVPWRALHTDLLLTA